MALISCPECGKQVSSAAASCPTCGHPISVTPSLAPAPAPPPIQVNVPVAKWSKGVAAVLSLIIPGAGQMYKGQVANGLVWLVCVVVGYVMFVVPGLILHLLCVVGAASGDPYK